MSFTVPSSVKPLPSAFLPGIPSQPNGRPVIEQARLVVAVVGAPGRTQRVYIDCPTWCVTDHSKRIGSLDEVMHYSASDVVEVATFLDEDTDHSQLTLTVAVDPSASDPRLREAHLKLDNGTCEEAALTPSMAEELADDLIAFAAQLRHKAREVTLYNAGGAQ